MSILDGTKELFVKYLDKVRKDIYILILDCNAELVRTLYHKNIDGNLEGYPLWLFHGGELINLYSTKRNVVATKDIDLKMYFTGDYSIPPTLYKRAFSKIKPVRMMDFDFYDSVQTKRQETTLLRGCKGVLTKHKIPKIDYYKNWYLGESQKVRMCSSLVVNTLRGTYSQLNLKTGNLTQGIEYEKMHSCRSQVWTNGEKCKAFILNTPYVTQVGKDNVPYDIGDNVLKKAGIEYDEDIDGYHVDTDFLQELDGKVKAWTEDPLLTTNDKRREYLERQLRIIRIKQQKYKLSTVVGVVLVYNESREEWYMFQEGLLDIYIDYSAGHHLDLEKRYAGRYEDGSFPSILKQIRYNRKKSVMRIPSLTWLIYDQLRMLYVTLRGEYLGCNDKVCKWVKLGGGAAGNHEKYFKKLQGILHSFGSVIKHLHSGNLEDVSEHLAECRKLDVSLCGPQSFLTDLFRSCEFELLQGKRGNTKKTRKASKKKRANKRANKRVNKRVKKQKTLRSHVSQSQVSQSSDNTSSKLHRSMNLKNDNVYLS